jgi:hypothetical protein
MKEASYSMSLKRELRAEFPGIVIVKNDPELQQGFPDLMLLYKNRWAALEVKADYLAPHQPNQDYWIEHLDSMSMAAFIFPENHDAIMEELRKHFNGRRPALRRN